MRRGAKWALSFIILLFLVGIVGIFVVLFFIARPSVGEGSVLVVRLEGEIPEYDSTSNLEKLLGRERFTMTELVSSLKKASKDKKIEKVLFVPGAPLIGWAKAQEIRSSIKMLRESGKPVFTFLLMGDTLNYYLASASDKIVMPPDTSVLYLNGIRTETMFFKGTFDKIGVTAELQQIGEYKNAADVYTRDEMTEAHREAVTSLVDDLYMSIVEDITRDRNMDEVKLETLIDRGSFPASLAKEAGLIDELGHLEDLKRELAGDREDVEFINLSAYSRKGRLPKRKPRIALIYVTGLIVPGWEEFSLYSSGANSEKIAGAIKDAREDDSVKAIVMRVDSGGGSAVASDEIWREVKRTKGEKPFIVSMSDVAASGGYWIAVDADAIVAEPSTITGSIGVISGKYNFRGLYDWIGLKKEIIKRGENADILSDYTSFSPEQKELIREQMLEIYNTFLRKVSEGRGMELDEVESVARGRVWTGRQALEIGLVDKLGGLWTAIEIAGKKAGVSDYEKMGIVIYPKPRSPFRELFNIKVSSDLEMKEIKAIRKLKALLKREGVLALMPDFLFHVNPGRGF